MKYLLSILFVLTILAIDPLPGPGTDTVQFNRTNKNVAPNGLNMVGNSIGATNIQAQDSVSVGGSVTTNTARITTETNTLALITNPVDDYDRAAVKIVATNSISLADLLHIFNGTNRVFVLSAGGTYYGRRLYIETFFGSDQFTRLQPGEDLTISADAFTNKVVIDPTTHTYYIKRMGTNIFFIDPDSGWTGSGTNFFGDDGKVHSSFDGLTVTNLTVTSNFVFNTTIISNINQSDIWQPGDTTNILAKLNGPFGTNLVQFGFNGQLIFGTNTVPNQTTSKFYIIQSYRDPSLGDPAQTIIQIDQINSGTGDAVEEIWNLGTGTYAHNRGVSNGPNSASLEDSITYTNAITRIHNGQLEFTGSPSRIYWNATTNTVFDTSGSGDPNGSLVADAGSTFRRFDGGGPNFYVKTNIANNGTSTGWLGY